MTDAALSRPPASSIPGPRVLFAILTASEAEQAGKARRIGFLSPYSAELDQSRRAAFQQGLRELGHVEGKNVVIDQRYAEGRLERVPAMVVELLRLKLDVLVVHGGQPPAIHAARRVSGTIPIVMVASPDPVGTGIVASLARPGGNITGLSDLHSELAAKRLEFLKVVVPSASRVAVLLNSAYVANQLQWKDIQAAAPGSRLTVFSLEVGGADDIDHAFATIKRERLDALNVFGGAAGIHRRQVADLAIRNRIPTISTTRETAEAGFLLSHGANFPDLYRRAATYR